MGNQQTSVDAPQDLKNPLRPNLSEENYLPMSLVMRKILVDGRKFYHVVPSREVAVEKVASGNESKTSSTQTDVRTEPRSESPETGEEDRRDQIEPVVTVVNTALGTARSRTSGSRSRPSSPSEKSPTLVDHYKVFGKALSFSKSPNTNRKYSLIDMQTGLKKSRFTLELEERLRQSKLTLGFDTDLDGWREFSYPTGKPEESKKSELIQKENVSPPKENKVAKDPPQYCAHNCQILGLCGLRRPGALEPAIFRDEVSRKLDVKHHKRDDCNCELCTLAYLTDMGFPEEHDNSAVVSVEKRRQPNDMSWDSHALERIRIMDAGDSGRSVVISVSNQESTERGFCESSDANSSFQEDCTNLKIKKMFKKNNKTDCKANYNETNITYNDINIINVSKTTDDCRNHKSRSRSTQKHGKRSPEFKHSCSSKKDTKKSSSSIWSASVTSSLSTILSYKRVREIFQSIIEKNNSRKRTRQNIHKFKEMEELGLGEVKNNRWYPSDCKTFSIWSDLHSGVQGVQAQFKKYPKTPSKLLT